jgi:hypothetical protein
MTDAFDLSVCLNSPAMNAWGLTHLNVPDVILEPQSQSYAGHL